MDFEEAVSKSTDRSRPSGIYPRHVLLTEHVAPSLDSPRKLAAHRVSRAEPYAQEWGVARFAIENSGSGWGEPIAVYSPV